MQTFLNILLSTKLFGIELIDYNDLGEMLVPFGINVIISFTIIRYIYYPVARRKDYLFTYMLFSLIVFFLFHLMSNTKLSTGAGIGLFAIMGIIRYRTDAIAIKEMTYLFVVIGIAVINALANKKVTYAELLFANLCILSAVYFLEKIWMIKQEATKMVTYENIDLIKPENHDKLIEDLRKKTGLEIHRIKIGRIDFLRDTAQVRIYYHENLN